MTLNPAAIDALAPDAESLKAAMGLIKPAKWPLRAEDPASGLVWGECQGSGANPYRVAADLDDLGSKCTCPSRKFPCKHALALLRMRAADAAAFTAQPVPAWVSDWVGRRRKTGAPPPAAAASAAPASVPAEAPPPPSPEDAAALEKKRLAAEKAAKKTADSTRALALAAAEELEIWIADQLRAGLSGFAADPAERCRRIAARMADGKAQALASRIDEAPARLLERPEPERPEAAAVELGKLVLLARAWRAAPEDAELRREIVMAPQAAALHEDASALRASGVWEVLAERALTRRDGLISQSTWLMNLTGAPRFALLMDVFPAAAGRRAAVFGPGERFLGEMVFYPARRPLRALIASRAPAPAAAWPAPPAALDPLADYLDALKAAPWSLEAPVLLGAGAFASDGKNTWWMGEGGEALPLAESPPPATLGMRFSALAALWTGARLKPLAGMSDWGRIGF